MLPYLAFLMFVGIEVALITKGKACYIVDSEFPKKDFKRRNVCLLVCLQLIVFTAMRSETVGADTITYLNALEYYRELPKDAILSAKLVWPFNFEIGYFLLTKFCAWLGISDQCFLLVIAALIYLPVFKLIYEYSFSPYISLLCYFAFGYYSYSAGIFRQMIAVSICVCSIPYIRKRMFCKFLAVILIAMTFHQTAIIFLVMYFIWNVDLVKFNKIVLLTTVVSFVFGGSIMRIAVSLMPRYQGYYQTGDTDDGTYISLILYATIYFLYVYICKNRKNILLERFFVNSIAVALVLQAASYSVSFFGRALWYFSFPSIVLIPNFIFIGVSRRDRSFAMSGMAAALFILTIINLYGDIYVTPYTTFFMK